jgi:hypothetical protein
MAPGSWSAIGREHALALASQATYCSRRRTAFLSGEGSPLPECMWEPGE